MNKEVFVAVGDVHIRSNGLIWKNVPEVRGDVAYALGQIAQLAKEREIPRLILSGDVFDTSSLTSSQLFYFQSFLELAGFKDILYIQGQHDRCDPTWISCIRLPGLRAYHLDRESYRIGSLIVRGIDFIECFEFENTIAKLEPADILVLHQTWDDVVLGSLCSRLAIPSGLFRLILSGDIHLSFEFEEPHRFYCLGVIYPTRINEFKFDKFVYFITEDLQVLREQLDQRDFREFTISDRSSLDVFCEQIHQLQPKEIKSCFPLSKAEIESLSKPLILVNIVRDYWMSSDHALIKERLEQIKMEKKVILRVDVETAPDYTNTVTFAHPLLPSDETLFQGCKRRLIQQFPMLEQLLGMIFDKIIESKDKTLRPSDLAQKVKERFRCLGV